MVGFVGVTCGESASAPSARLRDARITAQQKRPAAKNTTNVRLRIRIGFRDSTVESQGSDARRKSRLLSRGQKQGWAEHRMPGRGIETIFSCADQTNRRPVPAGTGTSA